MKHIRTAQTGRPNTETEETRHSELSFRQVDPALPAVVQTYVLLVNTLRVEAERGRRRRRCSGMLSPMRSQIEADNQADSIQPKVHARQA